jgi:hypothetical protein
MHLEQAKSVLLCQILEERRPDVFFVYITHQPEIAARPVSRCISVTLPAPVCSGVCGVCRMWRVA